MSFSLLRFGGQRVCRKTSTSSSSWCSIPLQQRKNHSLKGMFVRTLSTTPYQNTMAAYKRPRDYPFNVTVVGAAGGIGQPLSLIMKSLLVKRLNLCDVVPSVKGIAVDLSHISTPSQVTAFVGNEELGKGLEGSDIVIIPAGVPRKPGMTRDDLFNVNAGIVANTAKIAAAHCPSAMFLIVTNPVNSMVPIFAEVMTRLNCFNPKKVVGVTTLDVVRARTFISEHLKIPPFSFPMQVIGGHAGITILPLFSKTKLQISDDDVAKLTQRVAFGGDEVVKAKDGAGSATLSMAYAASLFARKLMEGMSGLPRFECAFAQSNICKDPDVKYFASLMKFGQNGIDSIFPPGELSPFESKKYDEFIPELKAQVQKGIDFGRNYKL